MTTRFFAVCDAGGLISKELDASDLSEAIADLKTAIADGSAREWIDDAQHDLEDELDITCDNMSCGGALEACAELGAKFAWGERTSDSWDIWSVTAE